MFAMVWRTALRFSHPCNDNFVKCFKSPIVVGSDSMDLQWDKSNIDNEEMLPMVWRTSLRFSHPCNDKLLKCLKSPIVVGTDSMDLQ